MYDLLISGEELIEVVDSIRVFIQQLGLSWRSFFSLYQIQNIYWGAISFEEVVEM